MQTVGLRPRVVLGLQFGGIAPVGDRGVEVEVAIEDAALDVRVDLLADRFVRDGVVGVRAKAG